MEPNKPEENYQKVGLEKNHGGHYYVAYDFEDGNGEKKSCACFFVEKHNFYSFVFHRDIRENDVKFIASDKNKYHIIKENYVETQIVLSEAAIYVANKCYTELRVKLEALKLLNEKTKDQ